MDDNVGPQHFLRETDVEWRLPNVVESANIALGYLDEGARGDDELTEIGYEENAYRVRAARDLLIEAAQALRLAVLVLRDDLEGILDSNVAWSMASLGQGDDGPRLAAQVDCIRDALRPKGGADRDDGWSELRDQIAPILTAIRAAQSIVGRPRKGGAPWLDAVIAGEAGV